jgi:DNA-binding GntR family transcriptional regulator
MLDPESSRPLYQQLAQLIREQIESGVLQTGGPLESEPEIAERYRVSRGTVRQALDILVEERLLERIQGKGNFVAASTPKNVKRIGVIVPHLSDNLTLGYFTWIEAILRSTGTV